ncbi:MerC family mercury resistance protein [Sphingomonas sp. MAH-20]|uniref:MerC family mercury resistance protein n=1 Tax=Sphingomonas horti TaxID=2682842 RepID=A0A6I4IYV6_9SPHN|nr:MerC domain-containing protein [Sphingomonas sp. CGMCC 1.13658]MVO77432.1 MerC family mercury resistance protein [Sphingomonas horti]
MIYCNRHRFVPYSGGREESHLLERLPGTGTFDRLAIGLSGLCLVHCVASVFLLSLLASAGGMLVHPAVHEVGLALAIAVGTFALVRGAVEHGYSLPAAVGGLGLGVMAGALSMQHGPAETVYTMLGVGILALGHDLNRRAAN